VQFLYQAQISTPPQDSVPPGTESVHLPRFELPEGGSKEKNMAWGSREGWCWRETGRQPLRGLEWSRVTGDSTGFVYPCTRPFLALF
jgi:hypothetical protein